MVIGTIFSDRLLNIAWIFIVIFHATDGVQYLGKFIGKLSELHHGVSGEVYAVDARTVHIKGFTYDGEGPFTYFYVGDGKVPSNSGIRIRDESGRTDPLRRYNGESITLTLPEGKTLSNIRWLSVWCYEFAKNFGDVKIPPNFDYPRPQKIDPLTGVHGISSDEIVIVDAQTLLIPHLSYDGEAPDAKFWAGRGPKPSPQGIRIPDENGKEVPLRRYDRKTVVLTLPGDLTVFDIGHFGIWCEQFTVDFGHVQIPSTLNIPPSLKMLGVSPQSKLNCEILLDERAFEVRWAVAGESIVLQLVAKLEDNEYMSFGLSGEDHASVMIGGDVVVAWVNKETLKGYADDYYLGDKSQCAGYTGSCPDQLLQDGADAVRVLNAALVNGYSIVTYQRTLHSHDRFDRPIYTNQSQPIIWAIGPLNDRNQVSYHSLFSKGNHFIEFGRPPKWNCPSPDNEHSRSASKRRPSQERQHTNKQQEDVQVAQQKDPVEDVSETTTTTTRRPQRRRGESRRRVVNNNNQQVAPSTNLPVNQEGQRIDSSKSRQNANIVNEAQNENHNQRSRQNRRRNGGRNPARNENVERQTTTLTPYRPVPTPAPVSTEDIVPWSIPAIQCYEPEDGVFYAQMGPAGGKKGYPAITGHISWGIAWYINGLLIPEINVVRGKTYTFVVEGGADESMAASYHPFYITDDPVGGYLYKTPEEREKVHIFAGAVQLKDGTVQPTGVGRLCHWTYKGDLVADDYPSFGAYQRHLELKCEQGEPGIVQWTPNKMTPDTVYYQCFTHRYLGWKINVLDSCDELSEASEVHSEVVLPPKGFKKSEDDLESEASYRIATVVKKPTGTKNYFETLKTTNNTRIISEDSKRHNNEDAEMFNRTFPQPMYVPQPNMLNTAVIMTPLFYTDFESQGSLPQYPSSPSFSMESKKPSFTINPHIRSKSTVNNSHRNNNIYMKYNNNMEIPSPSNVLKRFRATLKRPNNLSSTKSSHVVKKVIKTPKDLMASEQKHNIKTPVIKISKKPTSDTNSLRIREQPEKSVKKYRVNFIKTPYEPFVELSPVQASTEKLIEVDHSNSKHKTQVTKVQKQTQQTPKEYVKDEVKFLPTLESQLLNSTSQDFAVNTGFNPKSIVFERGFTPILSEKLNIASDDLKNLEIKNESEIGVLDIAASSVANLTHKNFINHKLDVIAVDAEPTEIRKKRQKSNLSQYLPFEEETSKSSSDSNVRYLPPKGEKKIATDESAMIFTTYDGKKIQGSTLTASPDAKRISLGEKSPNAAALIRSSPQFKQFRGELPPLDPKLINMYGANTQQATLNRGLETPVYQSNSQDRGFPKTKLRLVPQQSKRTKRNAHHTPEHTIEQMKAKNSSHNSQSRGNLVKNNIFTVCVIGLIAIFRFV